MSWKTGKAQKSCQLLVILIIWQYIIMQSGNIFRNYILKIHSSPWPHNVSQIVRHHLHLQHSYLLFSKVLAKYDGGPHSEIAHVLL
jgi:hypothetical protein